MYLHCYLSGVYTVLPQLIQAATDPAGVYWFGGLAVGWLMRKLADMRERNA